MTNTDRLIRVLKLLRHHGEQIPPPEQLGISAAQVRILDELFESDGLTVTDLARRLRLTVPTVSVATRKLGEDGFIERAGTPDARSAYLTLSRKGTKILHRIREFRTARAHSLLGRLSSEEQRRVLELLEKMVDQGGGA